MATTMRVESPSREPIKQQKQLQWQKTLSFVEYTHFKILSNHTSLYYIHTTPSLFHNE